jgi:hypothetical protein
LETRQSRKNCCCCCSFTCHLSFIEAAFAVLRPLPAASSVFAAAQTRRDMRHMFIHLHWAKFRELRGLQYLRSGGGGPPPPLAYYNEDIFMKHRGPALATAHGQLSRNGVTWIRVILGAATYDAELHIDTLPPPAPSTLCICC